MFDLNEEITKWRNDLAQSEAFKGRDMDELEGHLRDQIESLTPAGLSQHEAFLIAGHRLGDTPSLENEFAKVNGGHILRSRLFWMVAGVFAYLLATCLGGVCGNAGALIAGLAGLSAHRTAAIGIAAGALGYSVILLLVYLTCRRDSSILRFNRLARGAKGKVVLLTSLILALVALGGVNLLFRGLMIKKMSMEQFGRMSLIWAYVGLTLSVLLPVVLMLLLIKLRISDGRAVRE